METFVALLAGVFVGGIVMFFVYRNNAKKFAQKEKELVAELNRLRAK